MQQEDIVKAVLDNITGEATFYDERDKIILKRKNLTGRELKEIEILILKFGAKKFRHPIFI